jgi:hypothetical protein
MKKKITFLLILIASSMVMAQNKLEPTGNVGIGTTNPPVLLHIVTPISKYSTASPTFANIASFLSTNDASAPFGLRTMLFGSGQIGTRYATLQTTDFESMDGGNIVFQPQAGDVGIGTTSPRARLHLNAGGTNQLTTALRLEGGDGQLSGTSVMFASAYNGGDWLSGRIGAITTGYGINYGSAIVFQTNNGSTVNSLSEALRITSNGSVGIGTIDTKGYKLAVAGSAIATSVTVKLQGEWGDYVFKPTYKLPSLEDVKSYIDRNQHLPEMPCAAEVQKQGINLGEIVRLQMKKIEELTLYLIEQQKTNYELLKRVSLLEHTSNHNLKTSH